jgi:predicted RNA polymerase sigma factor
MAGIVNVLARPTGLTRAFTRRHWALPQAYLLQAQIAAEHATAPTAAATNFARIATPYAHLGLLHG